METPVTLWLSDDEYAALLLVAKRYGLTPEAQVRAWVDDHLSEARRHWQEAQWAARRKALETDPTLAATVDAATSPESVTR